jgi:hypothetical protein
MATAPQQIVEPQKGKLYEVPRYVIPYIHTSHQFSFVFGGVAVKFGPALLAMGCIHWAHHHNKNLYGKSSDPDPGFRERCRGQEVDR